MRECIARGNIAVLDTASTIPAERFAYAVNPLLPEDIVVLKSEEVPQDWHPRYQNSVKTYEYRILNREMPDPLKRKYTWHVSFPLDIDKMREAAEHLKGQHDFRSFCSVHTAVKSTVRTIYTLGYSKVQGMKLSSASAATDSFIIWSVSSPRDSGGSRKRIQDSGGCERSAHGKRAGTGRCYRAASGTDTDSY